MLNRLVGVIIGPSSVFAFDPPFAPDVVRSRSGRVQIEAWATVYGIEPNSERGRSPMVDNPVVKSCRSGGKADAYHDYFRLISRDHAFTSAPVLSDQAIPHDLAVDRIG